MPTDSRARAFIEANIEHYREVTLAVETFQTEVETELRSIWKEFKQQLAEFEILTADPSFGVATHDSFSEMFLRTGWNTGIQIGLAIQCRDDDDDLGKFAVFSFVWVKDTDLRKFLDNHVATHVPAPFVHRRLSTSTYIWAYLDVGEIPQAINLLRDSFRTLFECLEGSPEFCKAYNVSGPVDTGSDHRQGDISGVEQSIQSPECA